MPTSFLAQVRPAAVLLGTLTVLTGLAYPLVMTGAASAAFPAEASGSLVEVGGQVRGSALIGQPFTAAGHFWGRPSATSPGYNAAASSGSNLGPLNPALADAVRQRIEALRAADPGATGPVPADLVTASASGLDPDLSPAAVGYQVRRVARVRGLPTAQVEALVARVTAPRTFGVLGEPRVNVVRLNLALDSLAARAK
jgi:K+-transporting ATPase ATPase C chain